MKVKKSALWLKKYFVPHEGNNYKPHLLRHDSILFFFLLVIIAEIAFFVQIFIVFDKTKFLASVLPGVLTTLTNKERAENDAPPLVENELLKKAAQEKAEDMATKGYFAHTSPDGKTPWYWFDQVGYKYIYAGENLAVNFFESDDVAQAWMNSPTHRQNIVKKNYTEIGIGVANGTYKGRSTVFVAQLFGTPLAIAAPAEPVKAAPTTSVTKKPVAVAPKKVPVKTPAPAKTVTTTPTPATNTAPTQVKVLGEETTGPYVAPVENKSLAFRIKSFIEKILTSPRQSVNYLYEVIGFLVVLALLLVIFIKAEIRHPVILARGFALIAVILVLSFMNLQLLDVKTEVPRDDHNMTASVIDSVAQ